MTSPSHTRQPSSSSTSAGAPGSVEWRSTFLCCGALAFATLVVYSQAWTLSFINVDDPEYASLNPYVQAGLTLKGLRWSLGVHDCNWIPLTWLSLMLDSQIFGTAPAGYHVTNVLLHAANAIILFLALATATGSTAKSLFVAALFALHPIHVESVAWVAERKDVLSIFFGLLSLWAYINYAKTAKVGKVIASLVLFLASLLAKPTLVTLPFLLLLLDYWPLARLTASTDLVPATPRSQTAPSRRTWRRDSFPDGSRRSRSCCCS